MWNSGKVCAGCDTGCVGLEVSGSRNTDGVVNFVSTSAMARGFPFDPILLIVECDLKMWCTEIYQGWKFRHVRG